MSSLLRLSSSSLRRRLSSPSALRRLLPSPSSPAPSSSSTSTSPPLPAAPPPTPIPTAAPPSRSSAGTRRRASPSVSPSGGTSRTATSPSASTSSASPTASSPRSTPAPLGMSRSYCAPCRRRSSPLASLSSMFPTAWGTLRSCHSSCAHPNHTPTGKTQMNVYWDYQNAPLLKAQPLEGSVDNIISALRKTTSLPMKITAYGDFCALPEIAKRLHARGIATKNVPTGTDAADTELIRDMKQDLYASGGRLDVVVISGDADFAYPLYGAREAGATITLLLPQRPNVKISPYLVSAAHKVLSLYKAADGFPQDTHIPSEVVFEEYEDGIVGANKRLAELALNMRAKLEDMLLRNNKHVLLSEVFSIFKSYYEVPLTFDFIYGSKLDPKTQLEQFVRSYMGDKVVYVYLEDGSIQLKMI